MLLAPPMHTPAAMAHRGLLVSFLVFFLLSLTGCGGGVRFRSKTGRKHDRVAEAAVRCEEPEAQLVIQAGGEVIGTITSKSRGMATHEDLAETAQKVAAKSGGTHILLTEKGVDAFTTTHVGQTRTECVHVPGAVDCQTVSTPTTTSTHELAKASFVVFRLSPLKWNELPAALRPVSRE